jgi:lipopolysaccharide export system protein LptA
LRHQLLHKLLFFSFLLLTGNLIAQSETGKSRIEIKHADKANYKKSIKKTRFIGNVVLEHEGALMYCDSAWRFDETNTAQAFHNVRINQGDTLFLWGDYLKYDGNTKIAIVTGDSVRLQDPKVKLTTTQINLDRTTNVTFYTTGGRIISDENRLVSKKGYYNTASKVFVFQDDVVLTNPRYVIESDTLKYNSNTRFAYFEGPTTITSDSSLIYTTDGNYNTVKDLAQFRANTYLYSNNKTLTGDSMYYEKRNDFGEVFGNMVLHDTADHYVITGDYGQYTGATDSVFVTKEPVYSILENEDTLHVHGDTLLSSNRLDSLNSEYRQLRVFHKVRFFKKDLQGACDSLTYATSDSIFRMFYNPVTWNDSTQITGDTILMTTKNEQLDSLKVFGRAFIISIVDEQRYNQIKGRNMFGQFQENALKQVFVSGNGQSLYFPKQDDGSFIGMNRSISSNIIIKFKDKEVYKIGFLTKPEATLYPLKEAVGELSKLEGFFPRFEERPAKRADIFK